MSDLTTRLTDQARRGGRELSARRASTAFAAAADRGLPLVWLIPVLGLLILLGDLALGDGVRVLTPLTLLLLALGAPLAWASLTALAAWGAATDRRDGLALVDDELGLKGRLNTADEFLATEDPGPFELAAIEDGRSAARRAEGLELESAGEGWRPDERVAPHVAAGLLAVLAYAWLGAVTAPATTTAMPGDQVAEAPLPTGGEDQGADAPEADDPEARAEAEARPDSPPQAAEAKRGEPTDQLPDQLRTSEGRTGQGKSADAQGQSAASESRGAPSGQTPAPPKGEERKPVESKKPKKKDSADDPPRDPKEEGDPGGSTAGRGSAKGSNRNTVTSKWSAKDQVTTPDDQEIEDDEDTDDEEEEQENRGGMQPNLRDRRPPVSRDLRIGFGNQPSPDANGRGGPSEAKKSRGTASLVLGVPIPDRIKGQPNPGPTRITQERVEPSPEASEPVPAQDRSPRAEPVGPATRPSPPGALEPWMNRLIQRYLETRRNSTPPTP